MKTVLNLLLCVVILSFVSCSNSVPKRTFKNVVKKHYKKDSSSKLEKSVQYDGTYYKSKKSSGNIYLIVKDEYEKKEIETNDKDIKDDKKEKEISYDVSLNMVIKYSGWNWHYMNKINFLDNDNIILSIPFNRYDVDDKLNKDSMVVLGGVKEEVFFSVKEEFIELLLQLVNNQNREYELQSEYDERVFSGEFSKSDYSKMFEVITFYYDIKNRRDQEREEVENKKKIEFIDINSKNDSEENFDKSDAIKKLQKLEEEKNREEVGKDI